jgi:hypothetical protein
VGKKEQNLAGRKKYEMEINRKTTNRETARQRDRQTERQTDRETDRQTDGQIDIIYLDMCR